MKASKFTEAQIAFVLKQADDGTPVAEVCRKAGISDATFYNWRKKYAGLMPSRIGAGRAFMKFTPAAIERHIRRKHPGCPDFAVAFFVGEIAKKEWSGASIGKAVGITMQTTLRHLMTDYDQMLLCGWDRDEARRRVQPKVSAMIAKWKKRQT